MIKKFAHLIHSPPNLLRPFEGTELFPLGMGVSGSLHWLRHKGDPFLHSQFEMHDLQLGGRLLLSSKLGTQSSVHFSPSLLFIIIISLVTFPPLLLLQSVCAGALGSGSKK